MLIGFIICGRCNATKKKFLKINEKWNYYQRTRVTESSFGHDELHQRLDVMAILRNGILRSYENSENWEFLHTKKLLA